MKRTAAYLVVFTLLVFHSYALSQWVQTNGPFQGRVYAIASGDPQTFIASTRYSIYRSTDGGTHWNRVHHTVSHTAPVAYVRMKDTLLGVGGPGLKSGDNGATWVLSNTNGGNCIIATDSGLFIGKTGVNTWNIAGVLRSTDGGSTWMDAGLYGDVTLTVYALASNNGALIAGTSRGIYRSTDWGKSWETSSSGIGQTLVRSLFPSGSFVFAGTDSAGLFISTDSGQSWSPRNSGLGSTSIAAITGAPGFIYAGTREGLFRSTDEGQHWQVSPGAIGHLPVSALSIHGMLHLAGTDGAGMFRSTDAGATWERRGFPEGFAYRTRTSGDIILTTFADDIGNRPEPLFRSTDHGATWEPAGLEMRGRDIHDIVADGTTFVVPTDRGLYLSADSGRTWQPFATALGARNFQWMAKRGKFLAVDVFETYPDTIYVSSDSGQSWNPVQGYRGTGFPEGCAVFPNDSTLVLNVYNAAIQTQTISSTDWGATWRVIYSGSTGPLVYHNNVLYIGSLYGSYLGGDWTVSSIPGHNGMLFRDGNIFISNPNSEGLLRSTDNGVTWSMINYGLPDDVITGPFAMTSDYLLLPTRENGIWRRPLSDFITAASTAEALPNAIALMPNYPNPFNPATAITYALPEEGFVGLRVYNLLGQLVATLVDEKQQAGAYTIVWDAGNAPSGMYFYRLTVGNSSFVRTMMLVR